MRSSSFLEYRKGKYKSSLYHLELAQKLEGEYLNDKYNGQEMPS